MIRKRPSYRAWPKLRIEKKAFQIDREKVRLEYLSNPHYAWEDFCKLKEYNPGSDGRKQFSVRHWQQEWLAQQVQATEDGLMDEALATKRDIAKGRLAFPKEWGKTAVAMKQLSDYMVNQAIQAAAYDQQHAEFILKNPEAKRFKMHPKELATLALAQRRIQELHHASLLLPSQEAYQAIIPIRETDPQITEAESEEARLRAIEVELVGGGTLDENAMTQILNKWIDQQATPQVALGDLSNNDSNDSDLLPPHEVVVD